MMYFTCVAIFVSIITITEAVNSPIYFNPIWPQEPDFKGPFSNVALQWSYTMLQLIRAGNNFTGVASSLNTNRFGAHARAAVVLSDCMYDAYIQSKRPAVGNTISGQWITTTFSNTDVNIASAVSYSAYRALTYTFGAVSTVYQSYIDDQLVALGGQVALTTSVDPSLPNGGGNLACLNVISGTNRNNDGSNALGNVPGYPTPYQDYTNFYPINDPMPQIGRTNCTPRRTDTWVPARVNTTAPGAISITSATPPWGDAQFSNVKPFAQRSSIQWSRAIAPSRNNSATGGDWLAKNADIIYRSANLNDTWKALGNFWGENEGYGGCHVSVRFAMSEAIVKNSNLESTIKLLFVTTNSYFDALISQYEGKRYWQAPRPVNSVQCIYANHQIQAWRGPYLGVGLINGSEWMAYQPNTAIFPPNPEYPCGHCIGSSASTTGIALFYADPIFAGYPRYYAPGSFSLEPKIVAGQPGYIANVTNVPNHGANTIGYAPANNISVSNGWTGWTWDQVGFSIGESRIWWGIHYNETNVRSHAWGNSIGQRVYDAAHFLWTSPRYSTLPDLPIIVITASGDDYIIPANKSVSCLA